MKHFNFKSTAIAMIAAVGLPSANANAAGINLGKMETHQKVKPVRPFRGQKPWGMTAQHDKLGKNDIRRVATAAPSTEFEGLSYYDFLEGPDGTTWFYISEYDIESTQVSEWYTEENIVGYTFTIYDSSFQEVGKIKDKITLGAGETRVAHAVLDPAVSVNFFNKDANAEVMVYLAINTSYELGYEVHYYNKVYSIGGEKDAEGNDVSIATMPGRCVDTFNAANSGEEN